MKVELLLEVVRAYAPDKVKAKIANMLALEDSAKQAEIQARGLRNEAHEVGLELLASVQSESSMKQNGELYAEAAPRGWDKV